MATSLSPSRTPSQPGIHKTSLGGGPSSPPHPLETGGSSTQTPQEILLQNVLGTFSADESASMRQVWGDILTRFANEEGHRGSVDDALRATAGGYSTGRLIALEKLRDGEQITDQELDAAGILRYNYQEKRYEDRRSNGKGNYLVRWTTASKECATALFDCMRTEMGVSLRLVKQLRDRSDAHDWLKDGLRILMSGEGKFGTVTKYFRNPSEVRARKGRNADTRGHTRDDELYFLLKAAAVLTECTGQLDVEVYGWRTGGTENALVVHETFLWAGVFMGHMYTPGSCSGNAKVGRTFSLEQQRRGARNGLTGKEWADPETPDHIARKKKRLEDDAKGGEASIRKRKEYPDKYQKDCQSGANTWYMKAGKMVDRGTEGAMKMTDGGASRKGIVSGPGGRQSGNGGYSDAGLCERDYSTEGAGQRYFGLHIDVPTDELAARLEKLVQEDGTLSDTPAACKVPVVPSALGRTRSKGKFGLDTEGRLVLGVHSSHKPGLCVKGGTIPVTTEGPPYKVPAFAIAPIREMKVVIRNQHNQAALKRERKKENSG